MLQTAGNGLRLIVTGCGRSGTNYLADILQAAGVTCGHEQVFTPFGPRGANANGLEADSSWFAAPFLREVHDDVKVVHVVRSPRRVVESFFRIGLCAVDPWHHFTFGRSVAYVATRYHLRWYRYRDRWRSVMAHRRMLTTHTTCMAESQEIDRLWMYWSQWNRLVERASLERGQGRYLRVRLEDVDGSLDRIGAFVDPPRPLAARRVTNRKRGYRMRPVRWTPMPEDVRALALRYGYDDAELGERRPATLGMAAQTR